MELGVDVSFSGSGIRSYFSFPVGNGFRKQRHSAHTEMIAHEQELHA
jgi:hypothetical protein